MSQVIRKASITLPAFQSSDATIRLPGVYVELGDLPTSYIGVLIPGIGLVFKLAYEAVASGVVVDLGEEIELEIPSQLLPNITQFARKVSLYFAPFEAEHITNPSSVAILSRNFVPGYPFPEDKREEFLRGIVP